MAKTIAQLGYDNFNISGEVQEGLPDIYDFELYVENNTIKTKGYNILTNKNVTVENNAMKFIGGVDSYLTLDPAILNEVDNFILEIKFKPTSKNTISGLIYGGRIPSDEKTDNEFGVNIDWQKNTLYTDIWNLEYGSSTSDFSVNPFTLPLSSYGDINVTDDYYTLKIVRMNNFLASYVNGTFKKGYRAIGKFTIDAIVVGCENDILSSSSIINLDSNQSFIGYIEYIKIKNYKNNTQIESTSTNYNNFSIKPSGDIDVTSINEGYKDFASSRSLYYLPDALKTNGDTLRLSAKGDLSLYKSIDGGTMIGNIKPTDIVDLTRSNSKNAVKMTKKIHNNYLWDWNLHDDAYIFPNKWSTGYNPGVEDPQLGYHAKWVKEDPKGGLCIKFIDENKYFNNHPHRWLGVSYNFALDDGTSVIPIKLGDKLTVHFKAKGLKKDSILRIGFNRNQISTETKGFGPQTKDIAISENWEEYSISFIVDSDWNLNKESNLYIYGNLNNFETISWVSDIIVSKNLDVNMTSEQLYNLSTLNIKFNLSEDIGLDWSKPWTICYWKKPLCEIASKYNLDSLGSNTAKDNGRGYLCVGSHNASNSIVIRLNETNALSTIENRESNYFGNWVFISLKYDGAKLYGSINGEKFNEIKSEGLPTFSVVSNYFDSGYGYDLCLGGFDNSNSAAALYKDLLITKNSIISDEDLDFIYRTKINYNNGALTSYTDFKETL